jgi:hypothetical protein
VITSPLDGLRFIIGTDEYGKERSTGRAHVSRSTKMNVMPEMSDTQAAKLRKKADGILAKACELLKQYNDIQNRLKTSGRTACIANGVYGSEITAGTEVSIAVKLKDRPAPAAFPKR